MRSGVFLAFLGGALQAAAASLPRQTGSKYNVKPFKVDLASGVPRMLDLVRNSRLPAKPLYPDDETTQLGIGLGVLGDLRKQWLTSFDWKKEQATINKLKHYTVTIDGQTVHFIHERSSAPGAIPLILFHGWPGSFLEFLPLVEPLTQAATTASGKPVSFDVVIPSLPGYGFSSPPPVLANWTLEGQGADLFHTLMVDVLGYDRFAVHGTDLGAPSAWGLYDRYNATVGAGHFVFVPFFPLTPEQLAAEGIALDELETFEEGRFVEWSTTGNAYFAEHATKPNTIGFALQDNPLGQLAWIGEKVFAWSDPRAGTPPSVLTTTSLLTGVSLYYLTETFLSSVYSYNQNAQGFHAVYSRARTDAPMIFSAFKYNVGFWSPELLKTVGNLVLYRNHDFGGHFPGLDNPPAMINDMREIATYWKA